MRAARVTSGLFAPFCVPCADSRVSHNNVQHALWLCVCGRVVCLCVGLGRAYVREGREGGVFVIWVEGILSERSLKSVETGVWLKT